MPVFKYVLWLCFDVLSDDEIYGPVKSFAHQAFCAIIRGVYELRTRHNLTAVYMND